MAKSWVTMRLPVTLPGSSLLHDELPGREYCLIIVRLGVLNVWLRSQCKCGYVDSECR